MSIIIMAIMASQCQWRNVMKIINNGGHQRNGASMANVIMAIINIMAM
jgi:hypothetical protein